MNNAKIELILDNTYKSGKLIPTKRLVAIKVTELLEKLIEYSSSRRYDHVRSYVENKAVTTWQSERQITYSEICEMLEIIRDSDIYKYLMEN